MRVVSVVITYHPSGFFKAQSIGENRSIVRDVTFNESPKMGMPVLDWPWVQEMGKLREGAREINN